MIPLTKNKSFLSLCSAQFLGAANDHLFKMVVSLLAVKTATADSAGFLSMTSVVFIVPYMLFSGYAGHLSDRAPKRSVLVTCKVLEIVVMAAAALAMLCGIRAEGLIAVLFMMAAHSTFFSPSKYGCLSEIVPTEQAAQANGVMEASRYAAVILGTAAGGFLMEIWGATPASIGASGVVIAIAGWLCSLGIEHRPAAGADTQWPRHPWANFAEGMGKLRNVRPLGIAVAGITYFEALAALMMLNVLLVAKAELGISDAAAGSLGAFAAMGTAAGALMYGRLSGKGIALGFVPIAALGIAAALGVLGVWPRGFGSLAVVLFALGIFGGFFFVPLLAWLQAEAPADQKGLILSTNNFLNMAGVLGASGALWLLHDALGLTPRAIFLASAGSTAVFALAILALSAELRGQLRRLLGTSCALPVVLASEHANA